MLYVNDQNKISFVRPTIKLREKKKLEEEKRFITMPISVSAFVLGDSGSYLTILFHQVSSDTTLAGKESQKKIIRKSCQKTLFIID